MITELITYVCFRQVNPNAWTAIYIIHQMTYVQAPRVSICDYLSKRCLISFPWLMWALIFFSSGFGVGHEQSLDCSNGLGPDCCFTGQLVHRRLEVQVI